MKDEEVEDEDDALDQEDLNLIKDESNNEYDLQIAAAELLGTLFKHAKQHVGPMVETLRQHTLPAAF